MPKSTAILLIVLFSLLTAVITTVINSAIHLKEGNDIALMIRSSNKTETDPPYKLVQAVMLIQIRNNILDGKIGRAIYDLDGQINSEISGAKSFYNYFPESDQHKIIKRIIDFNVGQINYTYSVPKFKELIY